MHYQVLSFNYKHCEQKVREKLAFNVDEEKRNFLDELIEYKYINEIYILSTCNRVEIVSSVKDNFSTMHTILGLLAKRSHIDFYILKELMKIYDNKDAIFHIFSVISSLDSLVLGESQITGQVKEAFKFSFKNKTAGAKLNRVISRSIKCAAEVRQVTNISKNPVSIASIAVLQAQKIFINMKELKVIVIGAGEISKIVIKYLVRLECKILLIARNKEKAQILIDEINKNILYDDIKNISKYINNYPLLFSATSANSPVIKYNLINKISEKRLWFDLAIPRDIDNITLDNLSIFCIDDLQKIAKDNQSLKKERLSQAMEIVEKHQQKFYKWLQVLSVEPVIKEIRKKVNISIEQELERAIKKGFIPLEYKNNIEKMAIQMFNRFLHNPTKNMRIASKNSEKDKCIDGVKKIFNIFI